MTSVTGRLQKTGVSTSRSSARPGPKADTVSSMPYGPPLTLKKTTAASEETPRPRRSSAVRSLPLESGDEPGKLGDPFLDRARRIDRDLDLAARQASNAPGRGGPERDHQRLAVDAERVGHREDRIDLLHGHDLEHGVLLGLRASAMLD